MKSTLKKCEVCGQLFEGRGRAMFCSEKCKRIHINSKNKEIRSKQKQTKAMNTYKTDTLVKKEAKARKQSKTYGMLAAEEQRKEVKVNFPVRITPERRQAFHEIVDQYLLMEG